MHWSQEKVKRGRLNPKGRETKPTARSSDSKGTIKDEMGLLFGRGSRDERVEGFTSQK